MPSSGVARELELAVLFCTPENGLTVGKMLTIIKTSLFNFF